jgi:hypothetical protein
MKGRWAAGIVPKNLIWIIADKLAICERPGGYGSNHRKVRRQEEILWIRAHGFNRVVSILSSKHNIHAYEENNLPYLHIPIGLESEISSELIKFYEGLLTCLNNGEKVLVHGNEVSDTLVGYMAGFLLFSRLLKTSAQAITVIEQLVGRQVGASGRQIINEISKLPVSDQPLVIPR